MESRSLTVVVLLSTLCVSLVHVYIYGCNISVQKVEIKCTVVNEYMY